MCGFRGDAGNRGGPKGKDIGGFGSTMQIILNRIT